MKAKDSRNGLSHFIEQVRQGRFILIPSDLSCLELVQASKSVRKPIDTIDIRTPREVMYANED